MKLFLIVGTGRCGTQMLRKILNVWPEITVVPETHFIIPLYDKFGLEPVQPEAFLDVIESISGSDGEKWLNRLLQTSGQDSKKYRANFIAFLNEHQIDGNIRDHTEAFLRFLYGNVCLFGDKTPHYGTNLSIIHTIWPEANIIHLTRSPLDCATSMQRHPGFRKFINGGVLPRDLDRIMVNGAQLQYSDKPPPISKCLTFWHAVAEHTINQLETVPEKQVLNVKYEDLVFFPKQEIKRIASFLNVASNKKALNAALRVPKPFPEKSASKNFDQARRNPRNIPPPREHENVAKVLGYPINYQIRRSVSETLQEAYRGRYHYFSDLYKSFKTFIKRIMNE